MINEELKTFISKMRAAGKTDLEITAELKTAGWVENDINLALSEKPIHPFFSPRPLWSLLMIIPIVVSGLMVWRLLDSCWQDLKISGRFQIRLLVCLPIFLPKSKHLAR